MGSGGKPLVNDVNIVDTLLKRAGRRLRYMAKEIDQLLDVIRQARQLQERHVERLGLMLKAPA